MLLRVSDPLLGTVVSLFEFFDYIKVAKNAGAFLSRCSELLALTQSQRRGNDLFGRSGDKKSPCKYVPKR